LAERIVQGRLEDEEAYLSELGSLLERVKEFPSALFPREDDVATAGLTAKLPLVIVQYQLAPGAVIPCHDHRNYNGVLGVIDGEIELRSFEIASGSPTPLESDAFQIAQTRSVTLEKGGVSTLSRSRDNIHQLRARSKGARLIDVFTFFGTDARSVYLQVDDDHPVGDRRNLYNARWL
jgi:predicted metal-dependent enzyme (double-stranded beta helix superfamily)